MAKHQRSNRESKKPPQMTAKEKKASKRDRKRLERSAPLIVKP